MARWLWLSAACLAGFAALAAVTLFLFGETLFGSSRSTIDDYNRDALAAAPVPPWARLVAWRTFEQRTDDGTVVRYREQVYVTGRSADEVRAFYGEHPLPAARGVSLGFLPPWQKPPPPGYTIVAAPGDGETTAFALRAGQRVVRGKF
jgi:hypothetical protein